VTADELVVVLAAHRVWLDDERIGQRADLSGADLTRADLSWAVGVPADIWSTWRAQVDQ
jgi:Pentapeptide repeats (8 copies)